MPFTNALFFEGDNDLYPVGHLIDLLSGPGTDDYERTPEDCGNQIGLKQFGGYEPLRDQFPEAIRNSSTLRRIGVIADADSNPTRRWQSLTDAMSGIDTVDLPEAPPEEGWTGNVSLPDREVTVGLWMMPNNTDQGAVEDFLLRLIPEDNSLLPIAESCLEEVSEEEKPDPSKALVRTWLAWQEEPGRPLGPAVTEGYFDLDADLAQRFIAWVRRLFPAQGKVVQE
jgi:hypothetical protein